MTAPTRENTAAVVVTYHPPAMTSDAVAAIRPQVSRVLLIDNASPRETLAPLQQAVAPFDVDWIMNAANLGVAAALNQGCRWAIEHGFAWVLFLDQDTIALPDLHRGLLQAWLHHPARERVALLGPNRLDEQGRAAEAARRGESVREVGFVITAGSLLSLEAWAQARPFREDLFIDWVDHEYGWRLQGLGWKTVLSLQPGIRHVWGKPEQVRVLGVALRLENYPPLRRYYIVRNWLFITTRYGALDPWRSAKFLARLARQIGKVLLFESGRGAKFDAIVRGLRDGMSGRLGPRDT